MSLIKRFQQVPVLLTTLVSISIPSLLPAQALDGLCARVKMEIPQELTLERIGFEATLEVTNNDADDPLTDFAARLVFYDPSKEPGDPDYDASSHFFVQPPRFEHINRIDGNGVIGAGKRARVQWFIIPNVDAGGTEAIGKRYTVSCELSAKIRSTEVPQDALFVAPETITVRPDAQLDIVYFQPTHVTGDDPFTPEVESSIPFTLGVLVRNKGYGPANNLKIASQQPRIVENLQGLLLVAQLLGARVMDSPLDEASLTVELGTIQPGGARKGSWDMITSLSGIFTEFKASYRHAPELGGEATSVIQSIAAHFISGEVINDEPGRDNVSDFLADTNRDGNPDTLFETDGPELPVNLLEQIQTIGYHGSQLVVAVEADREGWGYFRLDDPAQGRLDLRDVMRSDGKVLHPRNAWLEERYTPGRSQRDYFLHVFDRVELGNYQYTVHYVPPAADTTPPATRIRFSGEVTQVGDAYFITPDTQIYFTSEDESPVSIVYQLNGGEWRPALPFTLREAGVYSIHYYASDAADNVEGIRSAELVIADSGPMISGMDALSSGLTLHGDTLSVRSGQVRLQTTVAPNPLDVTARVSVFRGSRAFPRLSGLPVSPTSATRATLAVSGDQVDFYRYQLNGGAWSGERPANQLIEVDGVSGVVEVAVVARPARGEWLSEAEALRVEWVVSAMAPEWLLSGAPSHPDVTGAVNLTVARADAALFRWRPDNSYWRAEQAFSAPVIIDRLNPGAQQLSFIAQLAGEWEDADAASALSWRYDPGYGSNYDGLPLLKQQSFAAVQGSGFNFEWDGRDADGRLQAPGVYTLLIELTDTLGNSTFQSHLIDISDLASDQQLLVAQAQGPRNPHGRGSWLVWQQRGSGAAWQIYAQPAGLEAAEPMALTQGLLSHENPRTDGRYVVWQARQADGSWDVRLADLEHPAEIMSISDTPGRNEVQPAVCWPWVVYSVRAVDLPTSAWQLEAFNVVTGQRRWIYPGQDDQLNASVDAGRVVWRDMRDPGNGEIYFQNLETGLTERLTEDLAGQFFPVIRGQWVVWQDNRHEQVELYGYHLLRQRQQRLTDSYGNKAQPYVEGNWVVYEDDSFDGLTGNLHLLDLASLRSVPLTYDSANKQRPVLVQRQVVWQQGVSEPFALRTAGLPALQPVFQRTNAIAVTEQLAQRFGSAFGLLDAWQQAAGIHALRRYTQLLPVPVSEVAFWQDERAEGSDFPLQAGTFLWVDFPAPILLDLGEGSRTTLHLQAGIHVVSSDQFPLDYSAYRLLEDIGENRVAAVRMLDAASGFWRSVEVDGDGNRTGADFVVPPVAVLLLELREGVSEWSPR